MVIEKNMFHILTEAISFFYNIDFAKNIVAELIGVSLEALIVYKIVETILERKKEKNFKKYIYPAVAKFIDVHTNFQQEMNLISLADERLSKLVVWSRKVKAILDLIQLLKFHEYELELGTSFLNYELSHSKIRDCIVSNKYEEGLLENIFSQYHEIVLILKGKKIIENVPNIDSNYIKEMASGLMKESKNPNGCSK